MKCPICGELNTLRLYEYGEQSYMILPSGVFSPDEFCPDEGNDAQWAECLNCDACSDTFNGAHNHKLSIKINWKDTTVQVEEF